MATRNKTVRRPKRGSEMLGSRMGPSTKDLQKLMALSRKKGVKLIDWSIYGQPRPDVLLGAFQVNPAIAGSVFSDLLKIRGIGFEIFPYGIPVPDNVLMRFRSRAGVIVTDG